MTSFITVTNARLHNLRNVTLEIPKGQYVAFTGLSGSGKSTLAFDILYKEGLRQYMESLGMLTFGLSKPPVDSIQGLAPTISIDQHNANHSPRSTVGTATEIFTWLRVLFARVGRRPCPNCGNEVAAPYDDALSSAGGDAGVTDDGGSDGSAGEETFPCPHCGAPIPVLTMAHFSFNKPEGACPTCTGLGVVHRANLLRLVDESRSIADGAVIGWNAFEIRRHGETLQAAARHYGFDFDLALPVRACSPAQRDLLFYGVDSPQFRRHFPDQEAPVTVNRGRFEGVAGAVLRRYAEHIEDPDYIEKVSEFLVTQACPECGGARLRAESRSVTVAGQDIVAVAALPLREVGAWLASVPDALTEKERLVAQPIFVDLHERVRRVVEVGADYLTMDRSSPSLSTGEAQRLRLSTLLGSELSGMLYVFDEPTVGLHARDTQRLIGVLRRLRDLGNTVLVVEHDMEMVAAADYVVDFGPGGGRQGGRIIATGTPREIATSAESVTGAYLAGRHRIPQSPQRRQPGAASLVICDAREHNLKAITVRLPLGLLIAVTGVSGSGKSTLIFDILDRAGRQRFYGAEEAPGAHTAIEGWEHIDRLTTIGQEPLGRMPRSNAATYSDAFTPIREALAATDEAKARGLTARHFSFNTPGGRCERCQGTGTLAVKMHFLPDVEVVCPTCRGRRFKPETLAAHYKGFDISQVLEMTVDEALELFTDVKPVASRLQVMVDVGLGYLQLGQPATTLSGGEAQRVKLAKELGRRTTSKGGRTLYLLDEPTTGLHPADTARLLDLLQRLVDAGNTVVVVEHNLDVVRAADWVIDLGPEGGDAGGRILAEGTPEVIAQTPDSHTGKALQTA